MKNLSRNKKIALIAAAIIYWLFPVDFIPDMLVGLGQLDDILVTLLTVLPVLLAKGVSDKTAITATPEPVLTDHHE